MVKLTHHWEGPPDHHDRDSSKLHQEGSSVEGETMRAVVQRIKADHSSCIAGTPQGLEEGEHESQSPPAILACTSPWR